MQAKRWWGGQWGVWAAALLVAGSSRALDPAKSIDQYPRDVWTIEQGLPQNSVEAIVQDRDGYLWLGTQEGLVRFDGMSFRVLDRATTPELGENVVASLAAGEAGSLWVGTTRVVCQLKDGLARGFGPAEGLPGRGVRTILPVGPDEVWLGTRGGGIAVLRGGSMRVLSTADGLAHDGVWWLARDRDGAVWAGTAGGVSRVQDGTVTSFGREQGLPGLEVRAVCVRRDGSVWAGTDQGVARLDGGRFVTVLDRDRMGGAPVYGMLEDAQGSLWIASYGAGLFRLVGDRLDRVTEKDGFPGDVVRSLHEDRDGSLWVGLAGRGLVRLKDASFTTLQVRHGLSHDYVTSVLEDGAGTLWVGTFGGGVAQLRDGRWSSFNPGGRLPSENVWSLACDRSGGLWVGTLGAGLAIVRGSEVRLLSSRNGLSNDSVRAILEDRQGSVWVATRNGLNRVRGDEVTVFGTAQGLSSDSFYCLHEDRQGRLWLGTSGGGVCRLDDGKAAALPQPDGLAGGTVYDILEDDDGTMWFGTAGAGIGRLRDGRWSSATTREGLFDNTAYRLLRDAEGFAWVSCNKGIFRVSLGELGEVMDGRRPRVSCMVFGTGDGLASAEANGGSQPAGWRGGDGRLWFPTIRGLAVVDPARLVRSTAPPPVRIEELVAAGESFAAVAPVRLGPGRNDLEIRYSGLEYRAPARIRFRYRLEGFDRDWVEAGGRRVAYYTNLPPGSYRFLVAAASEDGAWSAEPAALRLILTPPVWATWWFRLGGLLVLAALSIGWYRFRVHNFERERRVLERVVAERTAELAASRDQLAARSAQLEEINEIVKAINSRHALGELLGSILAQMRLVRGVDRAAALIWDREAEVYRFQASWGWPPGTLDEVELTAAEAAARYESGATEVSPDIFVAPNRGPHEADDTMPDGAASRSMLVLRMRAEERVEGYLVLESSADEDAFAERDLLLLESLREHILSAFIKSRMLAELQALNEKKNEFLGMAAHDLRSPLGLISGWTGIVMRSLESGRFTVERAVRELGRVVSVSEHLTHLVTELLDLSAIESGKLRVAPGPVDVQAVLDDSAQLFARLAAEKGITLALRPASGPCVALADHDRLIEVVTNLLSNALKFTPAGGSVSLRCQAGPGEVVVHVEDTGPGLTDEDLRVLFRRFGRLSARPTAGESSTGLGLAIVKKIVDAHGGRVWATSERGRGARFSFALPAA